MNAVLAAVREFAKHAVSVGTAPADLLAALYEQNDDRAGVATKPVINSITAAMVVRR